MVLGRGLLCRAEFRVLCSASFKFHGFCNGFEGFGFRVGGRGANKNLYDSSYMGVSENRSTLFWGSYNKDPTI